MKIGVIGSGYVGLVAGACLADFGHEVICMDIDEKKIEGLKKGLLPIYEPGLDDIVERNYRYKRLDFTTDMEHTVKSCDILFIAVGTPPKDDGSADLQYVLAVAENIGKYIDRYKVVVDKSTVPVGTGRLVKKAILEKITERDITIDFDVVSNPEFLREGKSVYDFTHPDRIVIGCESEKASDMMKQVYRVLYINNTPFVLTNIETAEMIKYASNAFLAVKISFINEMALLSEKVGANVQEIARAMGMDGRISPKFLHAGCGYGGSCFPKDTKAIVDIAKQHSIDFKVIKAAIDANEVQKIKMVEKIVLRMGDVKGKILSVLGLTFKPETDDMRDAPSLVIISELVKKGAKIKAFCPQGAKEAKWRLSEYSGSIEYCPDSYEAVADSSGVIILTEWNQFRGLDLEKMRSLMKENYFFDLRNIYAKDSSIRELFQYSGVGIQ
ncbi:MAG TPA: UDP-glucose/GDP-mannose dehydrogenase family protein [bacterium]|jgi:UDPglucose 6-dehydrogenase|nr:UDP-glucose/GDP-mannose dehydrogenase family protein [bacterium]HPA57795.1 UDP-glucose/GDP-mannose dehydrogenase family protein [bacterium]HQB09831.1 UDP-glucose/GDP-mannose dehydrogenase family protein [bacterium]HQI05016.1 UDP-glucose/GDP-mannose dehydrogenase family protein [bacterium]HQM85809.1 UDP-glucose/GDP-mannose dehydrogenase family protein [bacterium]